MPSKGATFEAAWARDGDTSWFKTDHEYKTITNGWNEWFLLLKIKLTVGVGDLGRDSQEKKLIEKLIEKFIEKFLEICYTGKMKKLE